MRRAASTCSAALALLVTRVKIAEMCPLKFYDCGACNYWLGVVAEHRQERVLSYPSHHCALDYDAAHTSSEVGTSLHQWP
jgi:hypothetical protein